MRLQWAYRVLQLPMNATPAMVKKAHRRIVMQCHPDRRPRDPEVAKARLLAAQRAYEALQADAPQAPHIVPGRKHHRHSDEHARSSYGPRRQSRAGQVVRGILDAVLFMWPVWVFLYLVRRPRREAVEVDSDGRAYIVDRHSGASKRAPHYDDL